MSAGQSTHVLASCAASVVLYLPAEQAWQAPGACVLYVPAAHATHDVLPLPLYPALQTHICDATEPDSEREFSRHEKIRPDPGQKWSAVHS